MKNIINNDTDTSTTFNICNLTTKQTISLDGQIMVAVNEEQIILSGDVLFKILKDYFGSLTYKSLIAK